MTNSRHEVCLTYFKQGKSEHTLKIAAF